MGPQNSQMMMENMGMQMHACYMGMWTFGILMLVGLVVVIVLQVKMLKELREHAKSR